MEEEESYTARAWPSFCDSSGTPWLAWHPPHPPRWRVRGANFIRQSSTEKSAIEIFSPACGPSVGS
jgi:hypothetical protein